MKGQLFLGKKTLLSNISKNESTLHKTKISKQLYTKPFTTKTLFKHSQGMPPSCNWSNRFTSIFFHNKSHLIYIANTNIVFLDLTIKSFIQMISSHTFNQIDKPAIILKYKEQLDINEFLCISEYGKILLFSYNNDTNIYNEDFKRNNKIKQLKQVNKSVKCGLLLNEMLLIITTNDNGNEGSNSKLIVNVITDNNVISINSGYCIDYVNCNIIDMIAIENNDNIGRICIALSNGIIEILSFNNNKLSKDIIINTPQLSMIFNLDYDIRSHTLFAIDKNGSLYLYTIHLNNNQHSLQTHIKNKFNDKSINENYLFFSICLIDNLPYVIISSNSGRIFIYQYISNEIIEVSENPHTSSIYSIIYNKHLKEFIMFSSDHSISLFRMEIYDEKQIEMCFKYHVHLVGYVPKLIGVNEKKCYIINKYENELIIYEYDYMKNNTKLFTKKRVINISKEDDIVDMYIRGNEGDILLVTLDKVYFYNYDTNEIKKTFDLNGIKCGNICLNESVSLNSNYLLSILDNKVSVLILSNDKEHFISFNENMCNNKQLIYQCDNKCFISFNYEINTNEISIYLWNVLFSFEIGKISITQINNEYILKKELTSFTKALDLYHLIFIINKRNLNIITISIPQNILSLFNFSIQNYTEYKNQRNIIQNLISTITNINIYNNINLALNNDITCIESSNNFILIGLSDGICLIYNITKDNLILKHQIKSHYAAIIQIKITSNITSSQSECYISFITSSIDHSVKVWNNVNECLLLNIYFPLYIEHNELLSQCDNYYMKTIHFIINQQSLIQSKTFINNYSTYLEQVLSLDTNVIDTNSISKYINKDLLDEITFTYYNNILLNYFSVLVIIINEYNNISNKKKINKNECISNFKYYINIIINKFTIMNKYSIIEPLLIPFLNDSSFKSNEDNSTSTSQIANIETLIHNKCFVEALIQIKINNLGLNTFISCLQSLKRNVYLIQLYHVVKIENIIQILLKFNK